LKTLDFDARVAPTKPLIFARVEHLHFHSIESSPKCKVKFYQNGKRIKIDFGFIHERGQPLLRPAQAALNLGFKAVLI
jgi:hypothetical protein